MTYTKNERIVALKYAKEHGVKKASKILGIGLRTLVKWNQDYQIYPVRHNRQYTPEEKQEMLRCVPEYGLKGTAKKFNISESLLSLWNAEYKIYQKGKHNIKSEPVVMTLMQKKEILKFANRFGTRAACAKYDIPPQVIANWRYKLKTEKTRRYRVFSIEQKYEIIQFAEQTSVQKAARKYDVNSSQIRTWANQIQR